MHKKLILLIMICVANLAYADTINVNWMVDGYKYDTTTCTVGGDLRVPSTPPTPKTGYHFVGWEVANYAKLEYIESTGTQYIDTGIKPINCHRAKGKFAITNSPAGLAYLVGGRVGSATSSSSKAIGYCLYAATHGNGVTYYPLEWRDDSVAQSISPNQKFSFDSTITSTNSSFIVDGVTKDTYSYTGEITYGTNTIEIFGLYGQYPAEAKCYSVELYNSDDELLRNFIPAKRNSDNVVGMYDTVSDTFFTNAGTGVFIAGPETGEYF